MKNTIIGFLCFIPYSMYLITILILKKYNHIRSPTIFYNDVIESNTSFYEPLLENDLIEQDQRQEKEQEQEKEKEEVKLQVQEQKQYEI